MNWTDAGPKVVLTSSAASAAPIIDGMIASKIRHPQSKGTGIKFYAEGIAIEPLKIGSYELPPWQNYDYATKVTLLCIPCGLYLNQNE